MLLTPQSIPLSHFSKLFSNKLLMLLHLPYSICAEISGKIWANTLTIKDNRDGKIYSIPISHDSVKATDLRMVGWEKQKGLRVLDTGFQNTAVKESTVTFVDGVNGRILFRGYPIEYLFRNHDWEEVAYLLIWGSLPSVEQRTSFRLNLNGALEAPPAVVDAIKALPRDSPPFALILAGLAAFNAAQPEHVPTASGNSAMYHNNPTTVDAAIIRTIATMAVCISLAYAHRRGHALGPVDPTAPFVRNVLSMVGFTGSLSPAETARITKTLERTWLLYADHELTNSTTAFLHVASTLTDPISACSAFVASGNGPLHGGAIDLAYKSFEKVRTPENVPALIDDVKAKKYRLFGYGHRLYKTTDPRLPFIKEILEEYRTGLTAAKNPLVEVALEIDRVASRDEYFVKRKLKANADLFGGLAYAAIGFDPDIITPLMGLARMPGVLAHWREATGQPIHLWRPQQIFVGS